MVAEALLAVADRLKWRTRSRDREGELDMAVFSRNFSSATVIGERGLLPSEKVIAGFSL